MRQHRALHIIMDGSTRATCFQGLGGNRFLKSSRQKKVPSHPSILLKLSRILYCLIFLHGQELPNAPLRLGSSVFLSRSCTTQANLQGCINSPKHFENSTSFERGSLFHGRIFMWVFSGAQDNGRVPQVFGCTSKTHLVRGAHLGPKYSGGPT